MTDAENIKAFECCEANEGENPNCEECPYFSLAEKPSNCYIIARKQALDLIKRKDAEIERLQSILLCFMDEVTKWENKYCLDISELPLIPIKGETEKIKNRIKAEAIKEFAEKLKTDFGEFVYYGDIDNLVKEMAGVTE